MDIRDCYFPCPATACTVNPVALRFALGDTNSADEDHLFRDQELLNQHWQIFGLLSERSAIKQAIWGSV